MVGLVLEGGGARGAYQVGVYKAFLEKEIKISAITGTSIGAVNGAFFTMGAFDKLNDIYKNISAENLFLADKEVIDVLSKKDINITDVLSIVNKVIKSKGLDISPMRKILEENIDEEKVRSSNIRFGLVTVELDKLKPKELYVEDIDDGKLIDYILASSFLPIFKDNINGKKFIDGGFYNNLPVDMLDRANDVDLIYAIRLDSYGLVRNIKTKTRLIEIKPSGSLGKTLTVNKERIDHNIKMGYYDTIKLLNNLSGKKYVFERESDIFFETFFFNITDEKIRKIIEILQIDIKKDVKRTLYEEIVPTIVDLLDIDENSSYKQIAICFIERIAITLKIDRFKIYKINEFISLLKNKSLDKDYVDLNIWEKIKINIVKEIDFIDTEVDKILQAIFYVLMEEKNGL